MSSCLQKREFKCAYCDKTFLDSSSLRKQYSRHMKTHQRNRIFCDTSGFEATNKQEFSNHQKIHANATRNSSYSKEFPCLECDKVLKSKLSLKIHMRSHTGERPFVCAHCDKSFADGSSLKKHERIHTGERPYVCNVCKKAFNQKVLLHNHLKAIHAKSQPKLNCQIEFYKPEDSKSLECDKKLSSETCAMGLKKTHQQNRILCDTCGLEVTDRQELINHQKIHVNVSGNSSYSTELPCFICHKVLKSKSSLKIHMRSHTGERPFVCAHCDKSFADRSSLKKHERIHTGERPYVCNVCKKAFNQKVLLHNHLKAIHAKSQPKLNCQIEFYEPEDSKSLECDKKLSSETCAMGLQKTHQQNIILCGTCGLEVTDMQELINHQKIHENATENSSYSKEFPCSLCDKVSKSKSSQKIHMRLHTGERPFVCAYCEKAFADGSSLRKHERIHTGEKPYVCDVCKKAFNQKVLLHNHLKEIHAKSQPKLNC